MRSSIFCSHSTSYVFYVSEFEKIQREKSLQLPPKPPQKRNWRGNTVAPFGGNNMLVLYSCPADTSNKHFVQVLHNEQPIPMPVRPYSLLNLNFLEHFRIPNLGFTFELRRFHEEHNWYWISNFFSYTFLMASCFSRNVYSSLFFPRTEFSDNNVLVFRVVMVLISVH